MGEEGVPTYTEWLLGDANLDTSAGNVYQDDEPHQLHHQYQVKLVHTIKILN